jgi:hypothetical protein
MRVAPDPIAALAVVGMLTTSKTTIDTIRNVFVFMVAGSFHSLASLYHRSD